MGIWKSKEKKEKKKAPTRAATISAQDRAMLQLKVQRDKLNAAQLKIEALAAQEHDLALQLVAEGKRQKALYVLRRQKMQETEAGRVAKMLDNINHSIMTLDSATMEASVLQSLKAGTSALQQLHHAMNIDDIEELMQSAADEVAVSNDIAEMLGQMLQPADEEDCMMELQEAIKKAGTVGVVEQGVNNNSDHDVLLKKDIVEALQVPHHQLPVDELEKGVVREAVCE